MLYCGSVVLKACEGQTLHLFHFQTLLKLTLTFPFHWSNSQLSCSGPVLRPPGHLLTAFLLCLALLFIFALACIQIIHTDPSGAWKQKNKTGKQNFDINVSEGISLRKYSSSFKLMIDISEQIISVFFSLLQQTIWMWRAVREAFKRLIKCVRTRHC